MFRWDHLQRAGYIPSVDIPGRAEGGPYTDLSR